MDVWYTVSVCDTSHGIPGIDFTEFIKKSYMSEIKSFPRNLLHGQSQSQTACMRSIEIRSRQFTLASCSYSEGQF